MGTLKGSWASGLHCKPVCKSGLKTPATMYMLGWAEWNIEIFSKNLMAQSERNKRFSWPTGHVGKFFIKIVPQKNFS